LSTHQTKDGRWFAVWYEAGKQKRKVFGRGDTAHALARQFDHQKKIERRPDVPGVSVAHVCLEYHQRHQVAASTSVVDHNRLAHTILPALGELEAETLSTKDLDRYVSERLAAGVAHTTIARELRLLKAAFAWASDQDPPLIARNPITKYKLKAGSGGETVAPPTPGEVARLIACAAPHLKRAILLAWHCGTRPGKEVFGITWGDVDMDRREVRVLSARKGGSLVRYVPLHDDLMEAMGRWMVEDEESFPGGILSLPVVHYKGRRISKVVMAWEHAKRAAGITRKLRPYDLRHAFATYALRSGSDLHAVSQVMGHSSPSITMRVYQHVSRDQHVTAVKSIPSLDNMDNTWKPNKKL
jgi:integrase